jgi:hypothetical protein
VGYGGVPKEEKMSLETPTISSSAYGVNNTYLNTGVWFDNDSSDASHLYGTRRVSPAYSVIAKPAVEVVEEMAVPAVRTAGRRYVQVIIADPDERVPLDQCILFKGEPKLTDATDQELFFEVDIKGILTKHNEGRVKIVDKKVKDRTEYLEPAKIRELKMVVVNIADL